MGLERARIHRRRGRLRRMNSTLGLGSFAEEPETGAHFVQFGLKFDFIGRRNLQIRAPLLKIAIGFSRLPHAQPDLLGIASGCFRGKELQNQVGISKETMNCDLIPVGEGHCNLLDRLSVGAGWKCRGSKVDPLCQIAKELDVTEVTLRTHCVAAGNSQEGSAPMPSAGSKAPVLPIALRV